MKKINLKIRSDDLDIKEGTKIEDIVINNIENAIASSYQDNKLQQGQRPKSISSDEQRKIFKLMDQLENNKEGIVELSDINFSFMLGKWKERNLPPVAGILRKIHSRIDKIICEDDYKSEQKE